MPIDLQPKDFKTTTKNGRKYFIHNTLPIRVWEDIELRKAGNRYVYKPAGFMYVSINGWVLGDTATDYVFTVEGAIKKMQQKMDEVEELLALEPRK